MDGKSGEGADPPGDFVRGNEECCIYDDPTEAIGLFVNGLKTVLNFSCAAQIYQ